MDFENLRELARTSHPRSQLIGAATEAYLPPQISPEEVKLKELEAKKHQLRYEADTIFQGVSELAEKIYIEHSCLAEDAFELAMKFYQHKTSEWKKIEAQIDEKVEDNS